MKLSPSWVKVLADAGIEAVHWSSLGPHNAPDSEIMAYARLQDYLALAHDLDFGSILAATHGEKPSVVQIRSADTSPSVIRKQVVIALKRMEAELDDGALLTIEPGRMRLRLLSLHPKP